MAIVTQARGSERDLVVACQAGDDAALSAFYDRFFSPIYRFVLASTGSREDAEDVTADVFLKAFRGIAAYRDQSKPVAAWLFRIARNEVADHYRRNSRRPATLSIDLQQEEPLGRYDPVETAGLLLDLARALAGLPRDQRQAVLLRLAGGLSTRQTAEVMRKPEGTVRSLLHHGIKALRAAMEK